MNKKILLLLLALCLAWTLAFQIRPLSVSKEAAVHSPEPSAESLLDDQIKSEPSRITISRLGIDLPIEEGIYNAEKQTWTLSWNAASFANMTVSPNAVSGKTLIYAHNTRKTFGPTGKIQSGDLATVTTKDGTRYTYIFTDENAVDPTDTSIFNELNEGPPTLVLLTCGGLFNETRRLMHFDFLKMENANV